MLVTQQVKQRTFSVWYNKLLLAQLEQRKAKALFDWRLTNRSFNAWKTIVNDGKLTKETQQFKEELGKQQRSVNLPNISQLGKYHKSTAAPILTYIKNRISKRT